MRPASAGDASRIEEFWKRRFRQRRDGEEREAEETAAERRTEKERSGGEHKTGRSEERKEEEGARPQSVPGLGDEAFWTGNQLNGALYVRKNNVIVRLSIGGPEDQSAKIAKARALTEQVLKRL
jgi:hypothetical protein